MAVVSSGCIVFGFADVSTDFLRSILDFESFFFGNSGILTFVLDFESESTIWYTLKEK